MLSYTFGLRRFRLAALVDLLTTRCSEKTAPDPHDPRDVRPLNSRKVIPVDLRIAGDDSREARLQKQGVVSFSDNQTATVFARAHLSRLEKINGDLVDVIGKLLDRFPVDFNGVFQRDRTAVNRRRFRCLFSLVSFMSLSSFYLLPMFSAAA